MKSIFATAALVAAFTAAAGVATAQTHTIALWPDGPAESNGLADSEAVIYVWPAEGVNSGRAVVICPGGGYSGLSIDHEGRQFARWFASHGITGIVLRYRLPNGHSEIPLADARQAMKVVRRNAAGWGVDPGRVGVMGFSAGGHLASTLLTHYDEGSRPDFGVLFYPVVTMSEATHGGSRHNLLGEDPSPELVERFSNERQVTPDTPPTLIFFSDDDTVVPPVNGTGFYNALKKAGVRSAIYFFPSGEHGWGFNSEFEYHEQMKAATLDWLARF